MVWVKLDDQFFRNPKARAVGKDGRELFLAGLCYSAGALTDGFIGEYAVTPLLADAQVGKPTIKKLTDAGMWREVDGGYEIHDYRHYQRAAADVRKERDEGKERAARSRERRANGSRAFAGGSGDPSSSCPPDVVSSSSSNQSVGPPAGEEEDWAMAEARQRLTQRPERYGPVKDLTQWLNDVAGKIRAAGPSPSKPNLSVVRADCGNPLCINGWLEDPDDSTKVVECECRAS